MRKLGERDLFAVWRADEDALERFHILSQITRVSNINRIAFTAFHGPGHILPANSGFNDILHVSNGEAITGSGGAVHVDIDIVPSRDPFGVGTPGALKCLKQTFNV